MINLTEKLPRSIKIGGAEYPVNTDFRIMTEFETKICSVDISDKNAFAKIIAETISKLFIKIPKADIEEIIKGLLNYYRCGKKPKTGGFFPQKRCYDYKEDANYIYAAFAQQYGDDLVNSKMHWWEFRAKFLGLTDATEFVKIMQYRCTDISKIKNKDERARLKKLQEYFSLGSQNTHKFANVKEREQAMKMRLQKRFKEVKEQASKK